MPGFSGLDAFEVLRRRGLDVPFILISGTVGEEAAVRAMKAGINDYLMKGSLGRLVPAIERELADAQSRRARREAEGALRESEGRYRALIETAPDAILLLDAAARVLVCNAPASRLLGSDSAPGALGTSFLDAAPPEERAALVERLRTASTGAVERFESVL